MTMPLRVAPVRAGMYRAAALLLAGALVIALAAPPAVAQETPFVAGSFAADSVGAEARFRHERSVHPEGEAARVVFEGGVAITLVLDDDGGREMRLSFVQDDATRAEPRFPAEVGHPLMIVFLEAAVQSMATLTGGSPDYIRSRLREALWEGVEPEPLELTLDDAPIDARALRYLPFAADPERARMGPFADLEMRFVVSDAVPGRLAALAFETPPGEGGLAGLRETIVLEGLEGLDAALGRPD
jgi:hypothetical protein